MTLDLEKIEDSSHLLELLIQMEDVLDSLDIYVYKNWINGEIIEGPIVKRHWCSFSLLYTHDKMPDPRGSLRLLKHDIKVEFSKVTREGSSFAAVNDDDDKENKKKTEEDAEKAPENHFWMLKITFPRRLLNQMSTDLDFYSDDVDIDDVESAKDSGIDNETAYDADQQQQPGMPPDGGPQL